MDEQQFFLLVLLFVVTAILYFLPFIPALMEWKTNADSDPFLVNFQDRSIVEYNVRIFREYIDLHFAALIEEYADSNTHFQGMHENDLAFYITGQQGAITWVHDESRLQRTNKVVLLCKQAVLPDGVHFENKVYARDHLETGINNILNEAIAEGDIHLNRGSRIIRLLSSGAGIKIHDDCILKGYVKARQSIHFLGSSQFQYLHAPMILFGEEGPVLPMHAVDVFRDDIPREICPEHVLIPSQSQLEKHIVAKKSLTIEQDCNIQGNIKCYETMQIAGNTAIVGAIICEGDVFIANDCFIQGPIVAQGTISIGKNCMIGTQNDMTTLIAQTIIISDGCRISGLILAKQDGTFQL